MFVTNIFPPQLILQSNYTFSQDKSNFVPLESKILSLINFFRTNPKLYLNYNHNKFEENYILKIINQINKQEKKLIPFETKKEIALAGKDYLNYLIENNIPKSYFEINKGNKAYFNLQQILSKYGQRKGKIFETVIINSISASEIVNKLIIDEKAVKIILNPDMKYICITSGFIPLWKNECVIIDIIEDFIVYNKIDKYNNKNGIQILNQIYFDENLAKIEEKYKTKTHKSNYGFTRNNKNKNLEHNNNTTKESEKYKNILPLYIQDVNPFYYKTKDGNFHKSFSINNTNEIHNKNDNKKTNLLLNINGKRDLNHSLNKIKKIKENRTKQHKIITKNLNLKDIKIKFSTYTEENKKLYNDKNDKNNEIIFDNNNNSFFTKENIEQINDISNINKTKKQNSFFSIDTDISSILIPKKNESFNLTPNKPLTKKQKEENINGFCLNDKEKLFKNNKREIKNMIKLYNQERMKKKKIINLRNDINNTDINEVKSTATFFYFKNKDKKENNNPKIYQKKTLSLLTDNNLIFPNNKRRIVSFNINRGLYKNRSFENINSSNNDNNIISTETQKKPKYLVIYPILSNNNKEKYTAKKRHIEEIDIDLSNYNNNSCMNKNNNKFIYKKILTKERKPNNNLKYNTELDGKYQITNISNINNNIKNTIKNKYIIINTHN